MSEASNLDAEIKEIVGRQKARNKESRKEFAVLSVRIARMYELFQAKDPKTSLPGLPNFMSFREWAQDRLTNQLNLKEKEIYKHKQIGESLIPAIGLDVVSDMPFRTRIALSRYQEAKHDVPAELIEFALSKRVEDVELEVNKLLSGGHIGNLHLDGKTETLVVETPRGRMKAIREDLEKAKVKFGTNDPAEAIHAALVEAGQSEVEEQVKPENDLRGGPKSAIIWDFEDAPKLLRDLAPEGEWVMVIFMPGNVSERVWEWIEKIYAQHDPLELKMGSHVVMFVS